jgi:hypothetical protein
VKTRRLSPRALTAVVAGVVILVGVVIGEVVVSAAPPSVTRLGAAHTDPLTPSTVPPAVASSPHPTVAPTLTQKDAKTLTSEPWMFINLDGRTLELTYVAGDGHCIFPRGFAVTSSKTSVEVWALSKTGDEPICGDPYNMGHAFLTLPEPLNGRKLVHAPTDQNWTGGSN